MIWWFILFFYIFLISYDWSLVLYFTPSSLWKKIHDSHGPEARTLTFSKFFRFTWDECEDSNAKPVHGAGFYHIRWRKSTSGWWLGHPSEKYDFVKWDDYSQPNINGKMPNMATSSHQPVYVHINQTIPVTHRQDPPPRHGMVDLGHNSPRDPPAQLIGGFEPFFTRPKRIFLSYQSTNHEKSSGW